VINDTRWRHSTKHCRVVSHDPMWQLDTEHKWMQRGRCSAFHSPTRRQRWHSSAGCVCNLMLRKDSSPRCAGSPTLCPRSVQRVATRARCACASSGASTSPLVRTRRHGHVCRSTCLIYLLDTSEQYNGTHLKSIDSESAESFDEVRILLVAMPLNIVGSETSRLTVWERRDL
jgi:hypothetical protein